MSEDNTTPELPSTAVIFQAPEPISQPARSRRASAPAGPPSVPDAGAESAPAAPKAPRKKAAPKSAPKSGAKAKPATEGEATPKPEATNEPSPEAGESAGDGGESGESAEGAARRRRRRGGRGRGKKTTNGAGGDEQQDATDAEGDDGAEGESASGDGEGEGAGAKRRRSRGSRGGASTAAADDQLQGSTRLQAKRQRRRENRDGQRRRPVISEAEFLARRESVKRSMVVREKDGRVQIAVLEDDVLVEHYVSSQAQESMAGNVYLGRVQNVLPGMEAAFVDVGRGRNAVLYAGEVNWDAAGLEGKPRRIELALKPGDTVMVQVTKDPIGHKGARVTSQISLAGRFLVYVPGGE